MPNDLVWVKSDGDGASGGSREGAESVWDLPPEERGYGMRADPHPVLGPQNRAAARAADEDARQARARGDGTFASLRESDAADLRSSRWDWGDARTWMWLIGMCVVFLSMVALCYFLPQGRHASPPPIRVY